MTEEIYIVIGSLVLYVISVLYNKYWLSKAYSSGGIFENIHPEPLDVLITLCPGFNSLMAFVCIFSTPDKKTREKNKKRAKHFFNIKEDEKK